LALLNEAIAPRISRCGSGIAAGDAGCEAAAGTAAVTGDLGDALVTDRESARIKITAAETPRILSFILRAEKCEVFCGAPDVPRSEFILAPVRSWEINGSEVLSYV
jgi:hypothetical protein